ncbi:Hsp70 family protein [Dactylosporangium siamense]|uniref:Hsp70 family protein n=1 Tax=Dactylosporangium siamense TaxID=685454 RepID=UPI0036132EDC
MDRLAIDLGTSNTVAVLRGADGRVRPVLFDGREQLPSAVHAGTGGVLVAGLDAERLARADPAAFEPNPKRRIDDGTVLLGAYTVDVADALAAVLTAVADHAGVARPAGRGTLATSVDGAAASFAAPGSGFAAPGSGFAVPGSAVPGSGAVVPGSGSAVPGPGAVVPGSGAVVPGSEAVVLTVPAGWGAPRRAVLADAAARAGLGVVELVSEPVAAAAYFTGVHGHAVPPGSAVLVVDLGAGTADLAVVRDGQVVAQGGLDVGGLDVDAALVGVLGDLVGATAPDVWHRLAAPVTAADRRDRLLLWQEVRAAKESLSRLSVAPVHVPGCPSDPHLTREELEGVAAPLLAPVADLAATLTAAALSATPSTAALSTAALSAATPSTAQTPSTTTQTASATTQPPSAAAQTVSAAALNGPASTTIQPPSAAAQAMSAAAVNGPSSAATQTPSAAAQTVSAAAVNGPASAAAQTVSAAAVNGPASAAAQTVSAAALNGLATAGDGELAAVFLVGGGSRLPLLARLLHARLGVAPTTVERPETVVAEGALHAAPAGPPATEPAAPPAGVPEPAAPRTPLRRRWRSPATALLVLLCFALPFATVSCGLPSGYGRAKTGGSTQYTGFDLATGGAPDVGPADQVLPAGEQREDRLAPQPAYVAALLLLAAVVAAAGLGSDRRRRTVTAGLAVVAAATLGAGQAAVTDRLAAAVLAQSRPPDGKTVDDVIGTGTGFWLSVTLLTLLALANLAARRAPEKAQVRRSGRRTGG